MNQTVATNVSSLSGRALDWAVTLCEYGHTHMPNGYPKYSTDWSLAGEIIEREGITIEKQDKGWSGYKPDTKRGLAEAFEFGDTALEAAMRTYVNAKLGEALYLPEGI